MLALLDPTAAAIDPTTSDGYAASQLSPAQVAWLEALPVSMELNSDVWLYHGTPRSDVQCQTKDASVLVVNPGSVGLPAYDDDHPYPHVIENGAPHARYAVLEKIRRGWLIDLRAVPYDHLAQAKVATRRQRPDWVHALATGRMPDSGIAIK